MSADSEVADRATGHPGGDRSPGPNVRHRAVGPGEVAAVLAALVGWGVFAAHASGGRAGLSLMVAAVCLVPGLVLFAPRLPVAVLAIALAPGSAAVVLNATSITGWQGLSDAASWLVAGGSAVVAAGFCLGEDPVRRRGVVLVAVAAVGLDQVAAGWWAWWGGGDRAAAMVGTFFWHTPFAGFVLGAAAVAAVLAVTWRARWSWLFVSATGLLGAGVVWSGSRAAVALMVVTGVALVVLGVRSRADAARLVATVAAVPLAALLMAIPVSSGTAAGSLGARGLNPSTSTGIRGDYYQAAVQLWLRHPVQGAGFGSFETAGAAFMPSQAPASAAVHSGWLQPLVDGGLIWWSLVVLATAGPLLLAARLLLPRRALVVVDAPARAAALGLVVLWLHAMVDLDWTYPALLAMYGTLAGVVLSTWPRLVERHAARVPGRRGRAVAASLIATVAGAAAVLGAAQQAPLGNLGLWGAVLQHTAAQQWATALPTRDGDLRRLMAAGPGDDVASVLQRTKAAAEDDPVLAQVRALALVRTGDVAAGLRLSATTYPAVARPGTTAARADVLLAAGQVWSARALVRGAVDLDRPGVTVLLAWLEQNGGGADEGR